MNRRLRKFDRGRIHRRTENGRRLAQLVNINRSDGDVFWVFPVVCRDQTTAIAAVTELRRNGFDATLKSRLEIVASEPTAVSRVRNTYERTVFLPWYPELNDSVIERMGMIMKPFL